MSDSPRTDAAISDHDQSGHHYDHYVVSEGFCRQLESELNEAQKEINRLGGLVTTTAQQMIYWSLLEKHEKWKAQTQALLAQLNEANTSHGKTLLLCEKTIKFQKSEIDQWKDMANRLRNSSLCKCMEMDGTACLNCIEAHEEFNALNK